MQTEGQPADLDRVSPAALLAYPLIVTRRDPAASRPAAAYRLLYQGAYYEVWDAAPARRLRSPTWASRSNARASPASAQLAKAHGAQLVDASPAETIGIDVASASHPAWTESRDGLLMSRAGRLEATFAVPHAGVWDLWLQGEIMPAVQVSVDGRQLASISGQLTGVATDPDTMAPLRVRLTAGLHRLTVTRGSSSLLAPARAARRSSTRSSSRRRAPVLRQRCA